MSKIPEIEEIANQRNPIPHSAGVSILANCGRKAKKWPRPKIGMTSKVTPMVTTTALKAVQISEAINLDKMIWWVDTGKVKVR